MPKPLAIFGAGLSAQAAHRLAKSQGQEVVLFDEGGQGDRDIFTKEDLSNFDGFVFSPGFAEEHPWRKLADSSGLPCMSELAFAAMSWKGKIIGITGTNGKTTLTDLLNKALDQAGEEVVAAGNIGYPFSDAVLSDSNKEDAYAVLEISSFQAELADGMELDALLWTNFAEDHLDRYHSMARYFKAKARLFDCLKPHAICVVGPQVAHWMASLRKEFDACTIAYEDAALAMKLDAESVFHRSPYFENLSVAAEFWSMWGENSEYLVSAANSFSLAPHRLNVVAERGAVRFWNDSKATNFHATLAALESVERPIVWIGGGRVKGGDVESFAKKVSGRIEAAVLYGEVAERLASALGDSVKKIQVQEEFESAVRAAADISESIPNSNVILSPGFSSFDQFNSYNERGKIFTDTVLSLKNVSKPS